MWPQIYEIMCTVHLETCAPGLTSYPTLLFISLFVISISCIYKYLIFLLLLLILFCCMYLCFISYVCMLIVFILMLVYICSGVGTPVFIQFPPVDPKSISGSNSTCPHANITSQYKASHERWCIEMNLLITYFFGDIVATTERRTMKRNFSDIDTEVLVGEVQVRKHIMFVGHSSEVTNKRRYSEQQHVSAVIHVGS